MLHLRDSEVQLLTPGTAPGPASAAPAAPAAQAPPTPSGPSGDDPTPFATAVVPHSMSEFIKASESKQNTLVVGGLVALFVVVLSMLGIVLDRALLVVTPIAAGLSIAAVWLWLRKKKLEAKLAATTKPSKGH